jgi:hypothetical protein
MNFFGNYQAIWRENKKIHFYSPGAGLAKNIIE